MFTEASLRQRLTAEGLRASAWGNGPHDRYAVHRHAYDKVLVAARGSIVFELPELHDAVELHAGDRLDLPAGTSHSAVVGAEGVTCLEAHLARGALGARPVHTPGWGVSDAGGAP